MVDKTGSPFQFRSDDHLINVVFVQELVIIQTKKNRLLVLQMGSLAASEIQSGAFPNDQLFPYASPVSLYLLRLQTSAPYFTA